MKQGRKEYEEERYECPCGYKTRTAMHMRTHTKECWIGNEHLKRNQMDGFIKRIEEKKRKIEGL